MDEWVGEWVNVCVCVSERGREGGGACMRAPLLNLPPRVRLQAKMQLSEIPATAAKQRALTAPLEVSGPSAEALGFLAATSAAPGGGGVALVPRLLPAAPGGAQPPPQWFQVGGRGRGLWWKMEGGVL